jgi:C-terminal processing protease CtpA/Prc
MKSNLKLITLLCCVAFNLSCYEDMDDTTTMPSLDIKDFVWKAMNAVYLYKAEVPNLYDNRFNSNTSYNTYLESYSSPEALFESLIYQRSTVDRFSWITDDYIALEQQFSGVTKTNGAEFNFYYAPGSSTDVIGIVRLVLPNSDASSKNLNRGQIFNTINGSSLTTSNLDALLSNDSYTLGFANYNTNGTEDISDDYITSSSESLSLSKTVYNENPIYKTEVLTVDNLSVGYLMYNGFINDYNTQLNQAFGDFQNQNIDHLVLDLRYNPGGSISSAAALGSMITGQFSGAVFAKLQYNQDLQDFNSDYLFVDNINGNALNSLNLDEVYVITTGRSASASEMIINSLSAYIDVIQVGTQTTGKSQASVTLYDSPDLSREGADPSHTYALQPLVAITVNKNGDLVPPSGVEPSVEANEQVNNYGVLGDPNETLLKAALLHIQGSSRFSLQEDRFSALPIFDSESFKRLSEIMYID